MPLEGGRTELTLICQHDLNDWLIPLWLQNVWVGDVLSDYVRKAEAVAKGLMADGLGDAMVAHHGLVAAAGVA